MLLHTAATLMKKNRNNSVASNEANRMEVIQEEDDERSSNHSATAAPPPFNSSSSNPIPPHELQESSCADNFFGLNSDPYLAAPESVYERYHLKVDPEQGDRAMEIQACSCARPHMRGLHCAWISFFLAFMVWFAVAPLLAEIQNDLNLTKQEVWTSSILSDTTTIIMRVVVGPLCDKFGARIPMSAVLMLASIPCSLTGLVNSAAGLSILRFFIGIAGSSFVMAQFWPTRMFTREIAGTANGMVGGWGNLGGAWTQVFMGSILFPIFTNVFNSSEKAWRFICVIPAAIAFAWGIILTRISDDAPMGNYSEMKKRGSMDRIFYTTSLRSGATKNTWILYIQYACCFGVELVMNNAAVLYFTSEFGQTTEQAAAIGSMFGWMNLFARLLGGFCSDKFNLNMGMRGRLWLQTVLLVLEGITIIVFAYCNTLGGAIATMCIFSIFTQAAEGAIYGVVPYVSKLYAGSVAGLVGAGGNMGSVIFGFGFRQLEYRDAFVMMGSIVVASSFTSFCIKIPCHAGLVTGKDNHQVIYARERHLARLQQEAAATTEAISVQENEVVADEDDEEEIEEQDISSSSGSSNDMGVEDLKDEESASIASNLLKGPKEEDQADIGEQQVHPEKDKVESSNEQPPV